MLKLRLNQFYFRSPVPRRCYFWMWWKHGWRTGHTRLSHSSNPFIVKSRWRAPSAQPSLKLAVVSGATKSSWKVIFRPNTRQLNAFLELPAFRLPRKLCFLTRQVKPRVQKQAAWQVSSGQYHNKVDFNRNLPKKKKRGKTKKSK